MTSQLKSQFNSAATEALPVDGNAALQMPGDGLQPDRVQFERRGFRDAETGRLLTQLTAGECHCYPLYYFIPTTTADGATIIFHRWSGASIQMYRLDVATGEAQRLTQASASRAPWRSWMQAPASGVRDQLSAFNVVTRELIYFEGNTVRGVNIDTLQDRLIHEIALDRIPYGLTGVSPDGRHFVFSHTDRSFIENAPGGVPLRHDCKGSVIDLIDLETGAKRQLLCLNTWITHVHFQDNRRIVFCHPPTENGILVADIHGNWYTHIRTQDGPNLDGPLQMEMAGHYQSTVQGIAYEMRTKLGLCDPYTFECQEYTIAKYPVTHIGRDPEARLWFFDSKRPDLHTGDHTGPRCICFMPELKFDTPNVPVLLMSGSHTYGEGQHSHLHPALMPDRQNLLFVGGDERTRTNHLCLLDVSDLSDTRREMRAPAR